MYKIILSSLICLLLLNSCNNSNSSNSNSNSIIDTTGSVIEQVKIGNQVWMLKNLDVDHYSDRDRTVIPEVKSDSEWRKYDTLQKGCWCYLLDSPSNGKKYGKLYNWYAVNDPRGLAPKGWHIPDTAEWFVLFNHYGGQNNAGNALRSKTGWNSLPGLPSTGNDSSGFTALPGMSREVKIGVWGVGTTTTFPPTSVLGFYCNWWTSTEIPNLNQAIRYGLRWEGVLVGNDGPDKGAGYSVRCIKD